MLVVSLGLRFWLAGRGGQGFWPDEARYQSSEYAAAALVHGQWRAAAAQLLGRADHPLFTWVGLPPAVGELGYGPRPALTACYFSLFSTLVIYLVWRVARRAGAGEREALAAAWLAACANSLFYYARHYFPYDPALALLLLALETALGPPATGRSFRAGVLTGLGFLTYEGYWLLGGAVLILHVVLGGAGWRRGTARAVRAGLGLAAVLAAFLGVARLAGYNLLATARANAATITQGDFHLGYRIISAYLWHAEGVLLLLWLAGAATALVRWARGRGPARAAWWLAGLALVAGGLVLFSDVVPVFVVYGRLVRQLVPFFCLATAFAAESWAGRAAHPRRVWAAGVAVVGLVATGNFAAPLRQVFPDGFRRLATAEVFRRQQRDGFGVYRMANDEHLWGKALTTVAPQGEVVLSRAHPLQFPPYQYEGFTAAQRARLNGTDISMRLVRLTAGPVGSAPPSLQPNDAVWDGYPGPVQLRLRFAADVPEQRQPLVTGGTTGRADCLFVVADGSAGVRFGYDCWGAGAILSPPLTLDLGLPHDVVVSMGALLPRADRLGARHSDPALLRDVLFLMVDGQVIWSRLAPAHTVAPETITFGANFVDTATFARAFAGAIEEIAQEPAGELARRVGPLAAPEMAAQRPADWQGALGPVALRCRFPATRPGLAEPILAVGRPAAGDLVFWLREPDGSVRFGFDRGGEGAVFSDPIAVGPGAEHDLVVSLGSMMPPAESSLYRADAALDRLRQLLFVSLDGQVVFLLKLPFDSRPEVVAIGANATGSSVAAAYFGGDFLSIRPADPANVLAASIQLASRIPSRPPAWMGYPGPVRLEVRFPTAVPALPEPLIVTGRTGKGDFIYVRYLTENRIRFGFDHWGVDGGESPPVVVEPGREHWIGISFGGLLPAADSQLYRQEPQWLRLRASLVVSLDGRPVFVTPLAAHPTQPGQITLGTNFIGGSTTAANFTGQIYSTTAVAPEKVLAELDAAAR